MFVLKPSKRTAILSQVGRAAGRTTKNPCVGANEAENLTGGELGGREGVKLGEKINLCKEYHASEVVRRLAG